MFKNLKKWSRRIKLLFFLFLSSFKTNLDTSKHFDNCKRIKLQNEARKLTNISTKLSISTNTFIFDSSKHYCIAMDFLFLFQDYNWLCNPCLFVWSGCQIPQPSCMSIWRLALNFMLSRTYLLYAYRGPPREMLHQCHEQITNDPPSSVDSTVQYSTMCKTLFDFFTAIKPHLT